MTKKNFEKRKNSILNEKSKTILTRFKQNWSNFVRILVLRFSEMWQKKWEITDNKAQTYVVCKLI